MAEFQTDYWRQAVQGGVMRRVFLNTGKTRTLFVYFRPYINTKTNLVQNLII